ncbi:hypothetical protein E8E12_005101 [Didymella heteroderae]|uniref:Uncharacterized protein n=1 Tax=Didymella heteroderae TaxID=1769908 RepID=A0A9P5C0R4_9PLEO|nr:hypothetical protein E8E12_005101 [Didymella heteroderae]
MPTRLRTDRSLGKKVDGEPNPEPPAAPPIIILSQNSSRSGSQPQEQDPESPHFYTSFSRSPIATPTQPASEDYTSAQLKPKPEPEPHPAPPVIILSRNKRAASASPPISSPLAPHPHPQIPGGPIDRTARITDRVSAHKHRKMGSKASKLAPKNGKLQSSQEKKDKEEMQEPTNYYTHRSKSMRRKAGKEAAGDGAGGVSMGSGGAGGAI